MKRNFLNTKKLQIYGFYPIPASGIAADVPTLLTFVA